MSHHALKTSRCQIAALALTILLTGCAVGNKHTYHDASATPTTTIRTEKSIAVSSVDQRSYVVSGNKTPDFVGLQRGGFGNPFDVLTLSGKTLASEFSEAIKAALVRNGANVIAIDTQAAADNRGAMTSLMATHRDRLLLLSINEWKADTAQNTRLFFTLKLVVTDSNGKEIATKSLKDDLNLGGSAFNPPGHAKEVIPGRFRSAVEQLLNSPEIASALK